MHQRIQKWLQLVTFGLLMLFVGAQFDHQAKTIQQAGIPDSDWSVDKAADMDRYLTDGQQVPGHYFGALNIKGQCQRDIMLLSLSSTDARIHNYEGEQVLLKVSIGERSELIRLPIL
ncbi:MAG: hypothetical protein KJO69_07405, partial [Gammaproteobacteria bacterium]|nr:hypothetical protein [Gammaproteobacteria bacterium]NNJ71914.1 hypothetical protein [Enterobacterales bacterium]